MALLEGRWDLLRVKIAFNAQIDEEIKDKEEPKRRVLK